MSNTSIELRDDSTELASRRSQGIEVFLFWHQRSNLLEVALHDIREDVHAQFPVAPESALDAFYHPYAYVPAEAPAEAA